MLIISEKLSIYFSTLRSFVQALSGFDLESRTRKECVRMLYEACARHILFPTTLRIELYGESGGVVLYRGRYGDVSKREYQGREVAVKTPRIYTTSDSQKIFHVGR